MANFDSMNSMQDSMATGKGGQKQGPMGVEMERIFQQLGPRAVFGEPVRQGRVTIVPVAEMRLGFGFGSGEGKRSKLMGKGGGGGGGRIIPWGYITLTKKGASFETFRKPASNHRLRRVLMLAVAVWGVAALVSAKNS
ncbi:MAG: hypothetical protein H0U74_03555 [Bradymonadaceae bacterium]|nr:hypothetical protein [Lujinxingiaceae bacterium]